MRWKLFLLLLTVLGLCGCGGSLQSVELHGFNGDKMVYKYKYSVSETTLDNGDAGYLVESVVHFSEGSRRRKVTTTTNYLNADFSLHRQDKVVLEGDKTTTYALHLEGAELVRKETLPGGEQQDERIPAAEKVYLDIPPLMFAADLTNPEAQKIYDVFSLSDKSFRKHTVRFVGIKEIKSGKKLYQALHYEVQNPSTPGAFHDYYLDEKTKTYLRMDVSPVRFILPD